MSCVFGVLYKISSPIPKSHSFYFIFVSMLRVTEKKSWEFNSSDL